MQAASQACRQGHSLTGAHRLNLSLRIVVCPSKRDTNEVHVIAIVLVLLADPAKIVDVALLLFNVVLDPVVQACDVAVFLLANHHVLKPGGVVVCDTAIRCKPKVVDDILKVVHSCASE